MLGWVLIYFCALGRLGGTGWSIVNQRIVRQSSLAGCIYKNIRRKKESCNTTGTNPDELYYSSQLQFRLRDGQSLNSRFKFCVSHPSQQLQQVFPRRGLYMERRTTAIWQCDDIGYGVSHWFHLSLQNGRAEVNCYKMRSSISTNVRVFEYPQMPISKSGSM